MHSIIRSPQRTPVYREDAPYSECNHPHVQEHDLEVGTPTLAIAGVSIVEGVSEWPRLGFGRLLFLFLVRVRGRHVRYSKDGCIL
jgi:hypothetical protein